MIFFLKFEEEEEEEEEERQHSGDMVYVLSVFFLVFLRCMESAYISCSKATRDLFALSSSWCELWFKSPFRAQAHTVHKTFPFVYISGADATREASRLQLACASGASADEAAQLRASLRAYAEERRAQQSQIVRLRELGAIAASQASDLARVKEDAKSELEFLRERVSELESRTDDDRLVGKLQRELVAVRTTYKLFARKYEQLRGQLRRKEHSARKADANVQRQVPAIRNIPLQFEFG